MEKEPPLGFFRGLVVERYGRHKDHLDIKRGGVGAVVELARVLALSIGSPEVNTQARIAAAVAGGLLSEERGENLRDAFEFISYIRLKHQAEQVRAGLHPDNFVAPGDLNSFDKRHLRAAFAIVRSAQAAVAHTYPMPTSPEPMFWRRPNPDVRRRKLLRTVAPGPLYDYLGWPLPDPDTPVEELRAAGR